MFGIYLAGGLLAAAFVVHGPVRFARELRAGAAWGWRHRRLAGATAALAILIPIFGRPYVSLYRYTLYAGASTAAFCGLFLLLRRFPAVGVRLFRLILGCPVLGVAIAVGGVSLAVNLWALEGVPHISDEVSYQFQAKAFAQGHSSRQEES